MEKNMKDKSFQIRNFGKKIIKSLENDIKDI